uniref:(northern house mosquito) hypothetical protein n=1 Tax=Culex pipiens TaxID=7175 RepID=A0A8D8AAE1_CULPI
MSLHVRQHDVVNLGQVRHGHLVAMVLHHVDPLLLGPLQVDRAVAEAVQLQRRLVHADHVPDVLHRRTRALVVAVQRDALVPKLDLLFRAGVLGAAGQLLARGNLDELTGRAVRLGEEGVTAAGSRVVHVGGTAIAHPIVGLVARVEDFVEAAATGDVNWGAIICIQPVRIILGIFLVAKQSIFRDDLANE